jgi:hypothetical protein
MPHNKSRSRRSDEPRNWTFKVGLAGRSSAVPLRMAQDRRDLISSTVSMFMGSPDVEKRRW